MADKKVTKNEKSCGLVMPISAIDGCSAEHWIEVKTIVEEAIECITDFDFKVRLVSDADDVGVIQKRIVQNLYSSDIVVCDVSGKNPNVMFELGMRLAFDKPTIIIKDDKTDYSFDTGVIEHISYRRDLRFSSVVNFKSLLAEKVIATLKEAEKNSDHSTFLKNFGTFSVASLKEAEVSSDKVVIEMLTEMQLELSQLRRKASIAVPKAEGIRARIRNAIRHWRKDQGECDASEMLSNSQFYDFVEGYINAPSVFDSQEEFLKAVEAEVLRNMYN